jgi:hypothetical protein
VVAGLEGFFCWYGRKVASHPLPVLLFCLVFTGLSAIGVLRYRYSLQLRSPKIMILHQLATDLFYALTKVKAFTFESINSRPFLKHLILKEPTLGKF